MNRIFDRPFQWPVLYPSTGLTRDNLAKIFQPFYTTKRNGLGMELPISRSIIEAHGSRLWAENNRDLGSTFYFTVPVIMVSKYPGNRCSSQRFARRWRPAREAMIVRCHAKQPPSDRRGLRRETY